jgi:hypothetical protein
MKTYGFNLLPQKSRALVKKEDKRDNYSVAVALLPFLSVVIWLIVVLINNLVVESYKQSWQNAVNQKNERINIQLAPILIQHGELVSKTNSLAGVVVNDINPERLFLLLDQIYQQDPTFSINGYGRNEDGSFFVNVLAQDYLRLSEVTRRFTDYRFIEKVTLVNSSYDEKSNSVQGTIKFLFNYYEVEPQAQEQ